MRLVGILSVVLIACASSMAADMRSVPMDADNCGEAITPFALSIFPGFQLPGDAWDVCGLRLNVFAGRHNNVYAVDIGGIANLAKGEARGIEAAWIYNQIGNSKGLLQTAGIANYCKDGFIGLQIAPINVAGTIRGGLQIGVLNLTEVVKGVQIGLVNYTAQAQGLQIGLLNIIADSPAPILPVANIGF